VFNQVIINDPNNIPAQAFEKKISEVLQSSSSLPHDSVRLQMLTDVDNEWRRPAAFSGTPGAENNKTVLSPDIKKLSEIIIPRVDIDVPTPLDDVITTLTVLSRTYDKDNKGLNFHVEPPSNGQPMPKIKLRELNDVSLQKLLDMACQDANYGYYDDNGVIQVAQGAAGGASTSLSRSYQTKSFPMTDATLTRLLGVPPSGDSSSSGAADNTFSSTGGGSSSGSSDSSAPTSSDTESRLKAFFQRSGIDFPNGSQVSYASPNIYVTNTPKNLEALGTFLKQFSTVKQAEIETRFLDVNQGDLQELGFNWNVANPTNGGQQQNFLRTTDLNGSNNNRDLGTAFPLGNSGANPTIVAGLSTSTLQPVEIPDGLGGFLISDQTVTTALPNLTIPQSIPTLPNEVNVGETATTAFSGVVSWLQGYRINMIINALDQKQGSDLMSAPKIVVMDQHDATITIAQQLRYPDTFSPIQSTVSPASNNSNGGGGSGGVTITAGTPNGFETANIGVDMEVTPHIYEDQTIEMHLQPTVTEFEGFIEYGGTSLAIQSGTTASVPSGFIQPIFDVRKIETDVTIFDGATVILGGLTRDEVKTVDDKVPVLGDLPLIGRLFQSKGETSQKRNLMIFVTANIISPGGAPANQSIQNITPGSVFQNPTIVTPNRSIPRQPDHPLAPSDTAAQ
jgi:general secretion pathway protein D